MKALLYDKTDDRDTFIGWLQRAGQMTGIPSYDGSKEYDR